MFKRRMSNKDKYGRDDYVCMPAYFLIMIWVSMFFFKIKISFIFLMIITNIMVP